MLRIKKIRINGERKKVLDLLKIYLYIENRWARINENLFYTSFL
jgi:hypothetical protein